MNTNNITINNQNNQNNKKKELENFKCFSKEFGNIDFCSNPIYKVIVFVILMGILCFFIWYVSRKKYNEDVDIPKLISAPFEKNK